MTFPPALTPMEARLGAELPQDTGDRFRHGTRLLRWRPDKTPEQYRMDQLVHELRPAGLAAVTT